VAFLTVQTSPGNHQAWIAVPSFKSDQDRKDITRRVKKQVTADSSATGSVRLAGTSNFKAKYIGIKRWGGLLMARPLKPPRLRT
jgi:hypothetical protein